MFEMNPLRKSMKGLGTAVAGVALTVGVMAGSTAQAQETVRWQVPLAFPSGLVGLSTPMAHMAETVNAISGGNITMRTYEPDELIPPFEILDAVSEGQFNAGFTWIGYDQGRIPVLPLFAGPPFGMEPPAFMAWTYFGGGHELLQEVYQPYGVHAMLCGIIGPEAAGWFADPLTSLDQIDGLRIRFAGIGGRVMQNLGASVTMIPGGELYQAMDRGTIDAMEFSAPAVDRILGMSDIVQNYVLPGWHQTFTSAHLLVNQDAWDALDDLTRVQMQTACRSATLFGFSEAEWENPQAMRDFEAEGVNLQVLSPEILEELEAETMIALDELASEDEMFARVLESQREWMEVHGVWHDKGHLPRSYYGEVADE